MPLNEEQTALIQKKLEGTLTDLEEEKVSDLILGSKEFEKELTFQRRTMAHLEAIEKSELKAKMLQDFKQAYDHRPKKGARQTRLIWYAAACFVLITSVVLLNPWQSSPNYITLVNNYYQPYDGLGITRSAEESFDLGLKAYENGDYKTALGIFMRGPNKNVGESQLYLLISSCHMGLNQPDESIIWLNKIQDSEAQLIIANKKWYLALAYLKQNKILESKKLLQHIVTNKLAFYKQADALLQEDLFK